MKEYYFNFIKVYISLWHYEFENKLQTLTLPINHVASSANLLAFQVEARTSQGIETSVEELKQSAELKCLPTATEWVKKGCE